MRSVPSYSNLPCYGGISIDEVSCGDESTASFASSVNLSASPSESSPDSNSLVGSLDIKEVPIEPAETSQATITPITPALALEDMLEDIIIQHDRMLPYNQPAIDTVRFSLFEDTTEESVSAFIERLYGIGVVIAAKYLDDIYYTNRYYASIIRIDTKLFNHLELVFLSSCHFSLYVRSEDFDSTREVHLQLQLDILRRLSSPTINSGTMLFQQQFHSQPKATFSSVSTQRRFYDSRRKTEEEQSGKFGSYTA